MTSSTPVIIVTSNFPPDHGGIQRYSERLAGALFASGRRVEVIAPDCTGAALYDAGLPYAVRRYRSESRSRAVVRMARLTRAALRASPTARVVAMSWNPAAIAARLAVSASAITVLAHGSEIARQSGLLREMVLRTVARGTLVIANSRFTGDLLRERGIEPARIVPCGVEPMPRPVGGRASHPTIITVGRLVRRKGYDRLIEALAELRERVPDARLVIVGDGPDRKFLEGIAQANRVADRVELLGSIDDEELDRRYASAWCFAMPNRREGFDVEGFGIVFIEAAMRGLPALGGRGSGADDAIDDGVTGLLVDPNATSAIADGLATLLLSPGRCSAMGAAARQRAIEAFSWASVAERVIAG